LGVPRGIVYILEVPPGILCIIWSQLWDFVHFRKILVGFCAYLEVSRGILCIFGISSYNFVHFWKFLVGFCAFLFISSFHFFSTKYVFLQHAFWLIAAHLKCINQVSNHRNVKFDFWLYCYIRFGDMTLDSRVE
jgi:hypothetical protein